MRADSTNTVPPTARGRDSIRISSTLPVDEGLFVLDLLHMPEGCGTWPAFWTLSRNGPWPKGGEIDIIEGGYLCPNRSIFLNLSSIHQASTLTVRVYVLYIRLRGVLCLNSVTRRGTCLYHLFAFGHLKQLLRTVVTTNCDAAINFNQGCGNRITTPGSFGSQFNKNDGGWYVMLKSRTVGIKIWFFPRNGLNVPAVIRYGAPLLLNINPNIGSAGINIGSGGVGGPDWGTPSVHFPPDMCPMADYFDEHVVVFDLTFCVRWSRFCDDCLTKIQGDWAGSAWASSPCRTDACPTCESCQCN